MNGKTYVELDTSLVERLTKIVGASGPLEAINRAITLPFALQQLAGKDGVVAIEDRSGAHGNKPLTLAFSKA